MNDALTGFLQSLLLTLDQSVIDYKAYLAAGKTYRFAKILKENNGKGLYLLTTNKHLLPDHLQQDAAALIHHFQVWTAKWEELEAALQPEPDDEFIFPNTVTFPRNAAQRLENWYKEQIL